jgi:hypothetical protein
VRLPSGGGAAREVARAVLPRGRHVLRVAAAVVAQQRPALYPRAPAGVGQILRRVPKQLRQRGVVNMLPGYKWGQQQSSR